MARELELFAQKYIAPIEKAASMKVSSAANAASKSATSSGNVKKSNQSTGSKVQKTAVLSHNTNKDVLLNFLPAL